MCKYELFLITDFAPGGIVNSAISEQSVSKEF